MIGAEARGGRADSAPTIDNVEPFTIQEATKNVRFHGSIAIREIPIVGKARPTAEARRTRWRISGAGTSRAAEEGPRPGGVHREGGR